MTKIKPVAIFFIIFVLAISHSSLAGQNRTGTQAQSSKDLRELTEQAETGDVDAQFHLAFMYDQGQGVLQDYSEALKWYRKAADQGFAPAQVNLGFMYAMVMACRRTMLRP